jgi:hypothetical protein
LLHKLKETEADRKICKNLSKKQKNKDMLRGENTPCRRRRARENKLDSRLRILKYEECATPPQAADGRKMKTRKHGVSACALLVACVSAVSVIAGMPCDSIYNINEAERLDLYAPCLGDVQSSFGDLAYEIEENAIQDWNATRWSGMKLRGGTNYRELTFKMPNTYYRPHSQGKPRHATLA